VRISAAWTDCNEVRGANAKALAKVIEDPGKIPCIGDTEFAEMRRKFMEAHPELRFDARVEPHRRFIETLLRDRIMHGRIPFVELSRCYVRGDGVITQTQGVVKDVDELLRVAKEDQAVPVRGEDEVFHRITCFLYAMEYVKVMKFDQDGSAYYLKELTKLRERTPGVKYLIEIDVLLRTEVEDRLRDENSDNWAATFKDVLKTRRDLWGTAVINVKSHMMSSPGRTAKAVEDEAPSPTKGEDPSGKKNKRKAQKEKKKAKFQALLAAAKGGQPFQTVPLAPAPFGPQGRGSLGQGQWKDHWQEVYPPRRV